MSKKNDIELALLNAEERLTSSLKALSENLKLLHKVLATHQTQHQENIKSIINPNLYKEDTRTNIKKEKQLLH